MPAGAGWYMVTARDHQDGCVRCTRNARSATIMAAATGSIGASQVEQTALYDPARPGQTVPEHGATVRRVSEVAVTSPDDEDGTDPPMWEGRPCDAHAALTPGQYRAVATVQRDIATTDLAPCLLTVHPSGQVHLSSAPNRRITA